MRKSTHHLTVCVLLAASATWGNTEFRIDSLEFDGSPVVRWQSASGGVYNVYWTPSLTNEFLPLALDLTHPQCCHTDILHGVESSGFYRLSVRGLPTVKHGLCVIVDFADTRLENYTAGQPGAVTNETQLRSILDQMQAHWRWLSVGTEELRWDIVRIQLEQQLTSTAFSSWPEFRNTVVNKAFEQVNVDDYDYDGDKKGDAMWAFVASDGQYFDYLMGGASANGGGAPSAHYGSAIFVDIQDGLSVRGPHIGNFSHETGHCFGLPDQYGTYDNVGYLTTMSSSWEPIPHGLTAWDRYQLGWLQPTVVTQTTSGIMLSAAETNLQAVLIPTAKDEEYFMVEYRKRPAFGFGSAMPVAVDGLAIYHIDEYQQGRGNNNVLPQLLRLETVDGNVETASAPELRDFWYPENPIMTNAFLGTLYYTNTVGVEVANIVRTNGNIVFDVIVHDMTPPPPPPNQLLNGDFEAGTEALPDSWTTNSWLKSGTTFTWEGEGGINNSRCILVESSTPNDAYFEQTVSGLTPGKRYCLSGWVKLESNPNNYTDRGACLALNGTWTHGPFIYTVSDWNYTEVKFIATSSSVTVGARLGFWGADMPGAVRFDNLSLVEE